jgi:2-hydroxychromene-2-carboxylate isomerase
MSQPASIDFWFAIGCLYTYLAVMRLHEVEKASGVAFRWHPFSVRTIMKEMDNIPASKPVKMAYTWRDVERRAARYGFPFRVRPPYPLRNFDLANRIAMVGTQEGWCADYVRAAYRLWFHEGREAGSEPNVTESLREIGQDPRRIIDLAQAAAAGEAFEAATGEARKLGIFGAPTFAVGAEIFWGDDRLDDAIGWLELAKAP